MKKVYQKLIDDLAVELGCAVVQGKETPGMMFVEFEPPMIEGPILTDIPSDRYPNLQSRFVVMLHELGHVFHGHTQGRPPFENKTFYFDNGVLKSEAQAWEYALEAIAGEELLPDTRKFMWERCLGSYLLGQKLARGTSSRLWNGNRHHVEFTYDEPDDYFWSIKERILNG